MNNIQTEILNDIRNAKQSIKVAVSWLTDTLLINELLSAKKRGLDVKIVVSNNELNIIRFEYFQSLLTFGADVRKEGTENPEDGNFMHYKFYIIDDKFAKSGSYNWSANATTNREKLDPVPLGKSLKEFQDCYLDGVNFFHNLENPEKKRAELALIEKKHNDALTPERLDAYRKIQAALSEQEIRHKRELEEKEKQRKEAESAAKLAEAKKEIALRDLRAKEENTRYQVEEIKTPVSEAPPRSYANEQE